jgi:hypothetical protein
MRPRDSPHPKHRPPAASPIILDAVVFILGVLILGGLLAYIGKRIFTDAD